MGWGDPRKKKKLKKGGDVPPPPPPPNVNFYSSQVPPDQKVVFKVKPRAPVPPINPDVKTSVPPPPKLPTVEFHSTTPSQPPSSLQEVVIKDKPRTPVPLKKTEVKTSVPPPPPLPRSNFYSSSPQPHKPLQKVAFKDKIQAPVLPINPGVKSSVPPLPKEACTKQLLHQVSTLNQQSPLQPSSQQQLAPPPQLSKQPPPPPPLPLLNVRAEEQSDQSKLTSSVLASVPKLPPPPFLLPKNATEIKFKFSKKSSSNDFASAILASKNNLTKVDQSENGPKVPFTLAEELKSKISSAKSPHISLSSSVLQVPFRLPPLPTTVILKPISHIVPSEIKNSLNSQIKHDSLLQTTALVQSSPEVQPTPSKPQSPQSPAPTKSVSPKKHPAPPPPVQSCTPPPLPPAKRPTKKSTSPLLVRPRKYHTDYKKRDKPKFPSKPRFATAPVDHHHHHHHRHESQSGNRVVVSLISQSEYMKRHLFVKSGVDRSRTVSKYQVKRATLRTYIPKTISQEINMGMWI